MYQILYLPTARRDLVDIVTYVSGHLQNPIAATALAELLVDSIDGRSTFPFENPVYQTIRPLAKEYRKLCVKNYFVFYWVDEKAQTVTVTRVLYARRNFEDIIE